MEESDDVYQELADQTKKGKTGRFKFLPWLIILIVVVVGLLWFSGMKSSDQAQEQPQVAEKKNEPVVRKKKIIQSIEVPKPAAETNSTAPEGSETPKDVKDTVPDKTPSKPIVKLEEDLVIPREPPPPPSSDKPAPAETPSIEMENYPYSLHMGSYRTLIETAKYTAILNKKGLSPYWVLVNLGKKGVWYRVFLGHFKTSDQANEFQTQQGIKASRIINTDYAVQLGLYTSKEALDQRLSALMNAGYCPYIIEQAQGQSQLLVGAFQTEKAAARLAARLKNSGIDCKAVLR